MLRLRSIYFISAHKKGIIAFTAILIIGFISARLAIHIVSLIDPTRLVPISSLDILRAIPLTIVLYALGSAIATRFFVHQAIEWYTVLFIIRALLAIFLSAVFQYDDERGFHYAGVEQVYGTISFGAGRAYYHLVNVLYWIFGANILLPKMVNVFLGSLLPYFAFDIARWMFGDRKYGWRAFLLTGVLPPFVIFSAVNLKEIATAFLIVLLVWILTNLRHGYLQRLIMSGLCILMIYWLRGAPLAMIGVIGIISYHILSTRLRFSHFIKVALIVLVVSLFIPLLFKEMRQTIWSRMTQEEYYIEGFSKSEATVTRFLNVEEPLSPRNLAILFLRGIFSPVPWRFILDYHIDTLLESLNMLSWYILFPLMLMSVLAHKKKKPVCVAGIIVAALLAIVTMGVAVGTDPYRHRMMTMGVVTILAVGGLTRDVIRHFRWVIWLWVIGVVGFTGFWLTLRIG